MEKLKRTKGITLVGLVVTIIVLLILSGVAINIAIGDNGIISKAKNTIELYKQAKIMEEEELENLYKQIILNENIDKESIDLAIFKKQIAKYIEEAGGIKPAEDSDAETFGESIKGIFKENTKDATIHPDDIAKGKIAYANGERIEGTSDNIKILETGTFTASARQGLGQTTITVNFKNTYTKEDKARFIMTGYTGNGFYPYSPINHNGSQITGNKFTTTLINGSGGENTVTTTVSYIILGGLE